MTTAAAVIAAVRLALSAPVAVIADVAETAAESAPASVFGEAVTTDVAAMDAAINAMGGKQVNAATSIKELLNDPRYRQVMANFMRTGSYGAGVSPADKAMAFDFTVMGKLYDQSGKVVGELSKQNSHRAVQQ